ncbi:glycoside hydrolase family 125 protein [Occultella kanbiaonis]|uniref:glycoside hydrolase family 125 protein n=1 Tax=Occultella kanbiaonis TaxID=2675754 RepID=UPI0013D64A78|nr:glycoside hydrolase family 125 protein [Occultella kanbiaonis]
MHTATDPTNPGMPHPQGLDLDAELLRTVTERVARATGQEQAGAAVARLLTNTARTTVRILGPADTFVITGDIPAMWLRDSAAQVAPLLRLGPLAPELLDVVAGLLRRHWRMIGIDAYANAFNQEPDGSRWDDDVPLPGPWVWERKWEIDSLAYPLDLADRLAGLGCTAWIDEHTYPALAAAVRLLETEQDHEAHSLYRFQRRDVPLSDTLARAGRGEPVAPCGLVWSGFRPSDDAGEHGYNVPGNAFAARALAAVPHLVDLVLARTGRTDDADVSGRATRLSASITAGLRAHAVVRGPEGADVLAYEVDGAGAAVLMDDANVPSLLSLPYLDAIAADSPLYLATRALVLSPANPWYVVGSAMRGVGSRHTPAHHVWPIALAVQALTSTDDTERSGLLSTLLQTTGGTGYMHEGVHADDPSTYTRPWFSWANSMYCELALDLAGFARPAVSTAPVL